MHETVHLDDFQRHLLTLLDGARNLDQISETLAGLIVRGELIVYEAQRRITDLTEARRITRQSLPAAMQGLARLALFASAP